MRRQKRALKNNNVKFLPILVTTNHATIAFIKSLLDGEKINYYIENENVSLLADAPPQMTVMVLDKDAKNAEELLKDVK